MGGEKQEGRSERRDLDNIIPPSQETVQTTEKRNDRHSGAAQGQTIIRQ